MCVVAQSDQRIIEPVDIEQSYADTLLAEFCLGGGVKHLIERADGSGQGNGGVGVIDHVGLPLGEILDENLLLATRIDWMLLDERGNRHANGVAARIHEGICHRLHETSVTATVDESVATLGEYAAKVAGGSFDFLGRMTRTAEYGDRCFIHSGVYFTMNGKSKDVDQLLNSSAM